MQGLWQAVPERSSERASITLLRTPAAKRPSSQSEVMPPGIIPCTKRKEPMDIQKIVTELSGERDQSGCADPFSGLTY
jgi:hypothetical protein